MAASCFSFISLYGRYLRRTFTAAGLSQETVDIDAKTTICYWCPRPDSRSMEKPSLVLIHGFGPNSLFQWKHQAISLGKLLENLGVNRYSVMGTSYGGMVAYHMASMWPERVEKVVIASSAVNMIQKDHEELLERAKVKIIDDLMLPKTAAQLRNLIRMTMFKLPPVLPDFLLNNFHTLFAENEEEKRELLKGITIGRDNTVHVFPLQQEVLIVWGEHDQIFPLKKAFELKELLGEKVQLEVLKNTSHGPQVEDPNKFNAVVKEFLC
ncbi:hypothetical protein NE237_027324 [Protea cynaroides]|uniref:AB hydrolase-1 domain-containing protein n=1 Tax=Protea cynaroides TaxID=273540 RepID=A0A9Q0JT19_9MAGN|nr:hypothetical protein NE237_027324 [Protea cynaroides]